MAPSVNILIYEHQSITELIEGWRCGIYSAGNQGPPPRTQSRGRDLAKRVRIVPRAARYIGADVRGFVAFLWRGVKSNLAWLGS